MIGLYIIQSFILLLFLFLLLNINFIKYYSYDITFSLLELNNDLRFDVNFFENSIIQIYQSLTFDYLSYPLFFFGFLMLFISTCISLLFISYLGLYGVFIFNLVSIFLMWFFILFTFIDIISFNSYYYIEVGNWMFLNSNFRVNFSLFIDFVSISFSFLTTSIALCVYIFTFSYFRYEPLVERLLLLLNLFVLSMVLLVSSGNLIVLFLGWEMIGMTSFFLINFWASRIGTLKSAFKAYSFNKVSDVFIFFSCLLLYNTTFSLDIPTIISSIHLYINHDLHIGFITLPIIDVVSFSFLGAAFIKSAQIGAHIWLPDSMEAPVPASALIHSATLVSAGIYLLLRFTVIFQLSTYSYYLILIMGSITAFYGGWVSAYQSDLKRILAYSTISHCGFLMVVYTTFIPEYTVLYLYVHGFFKAAVFLSVGNVLRFNRNIQDFRRMGGLYKYLPYDSIACFLCLANLSGLPFTFGYFIKHLLFVGLSSNLFFYYTAWSFLFIGAIIGLFYSFRLYYHTFFDIKKGKKVHYVQSNRNILNSKFFSNSSFGGNIAIAVLFIISYIVNFYLMISFLNLNINSGISVDGEVSLNIFTTFVEYSTILINGCLINSVVILLIISILFSVWRYSIKYWFILNNLSILFVFFITLIFFINIIYIFMWGNSSADASYQNNFNVGFSTTRSDVLVHLAQWQYWWWFWFAFLWCFYYLVLIRTVKQRALKMRPKINTSYRPHSKWGDFLACIVPTIWCINILTNSNLILRLIEWQNESSLFTIRIRGRQWYWIYKFELKNFTDVLSAPKNVGTNKWLVSTFGDLQTADDYLHVLQLRAQSKWIKSYWQEGLTRDVKPNNHHLVSSIEQLKIKLDNTYVLNDFSNTTNLLVSSKTTSTNLNISTFSPLTNYKSAVNSINANSFISNIENPDYSIFNNIENFEYKTNFIKLDNLNLFNISKTSDNYLSSDLIETSRWAKRSLGTHIPLRILKNQVDYINPTYSTSNNYVEDDLFSLRYGSGDNNIQSKPTPHTKYLTLKQQRSKKKKIAPIQKTFKTLENDTLVTTRYSGHQILTSNRTIDTNQLDSNIQYKLFSKNRSRTEHTSVTLARRILRTKKILVIPAHVNITAITNSYDVVHSWFIPGLGIKIDCVPGRSTHHTFFVDNVGFYYGQCAEICGRYHHHMPIRLCALPFEHFLVWWQSFGMSKLLFTNNQKKYNAHYAFRKYVW